MKFNAIISLTVACFITFITSAVLKSIPLIITSAVVCFAGQLWIIDRLLRAISKQDKAIDQFKKTFNK